MRSNARSRLLDGDGADHRSYVKEGDVRCDTRGVDPVSWKELAQCLIGGIETGENLDMQY